MTKKILHIASCSSFLPSFIKCINDKFNSERHEFLITSGLADSELSDFKNVKLFILNGFSKKILYYFELLYKMQVAERIVIHGLFNQRLVKILFIFPWLLKKCYWAVWGGDLYVYQLGRRNWKWHVNEFFRRPVIKNMGHLVTYVEGDVQLARNWYRAKGKYHECLMYHSNLYKNYTLPNKDSDIINIQVGNSSDPSNNHIELLEKLLPFKDQNIRILTPLSYGSPTHAKKVMELGVEWFGDKFQPITEVMSFDRYLGFLGSVDIALFNHERQQAMGNTITLLGLGKTVYMRSDTTQWLLFEEKNIAVKDIQKFNSLDFKHDECNAEMIAKYFSAENYHKQLHKLFS
ncbi:TDP-N-acetylfucosamine:lipid II N-acetylfucosaminyltransferase [Rheinheimera sp. EpRS3]|uniref:TDP-N-acetylfucosamine:lipid II N-acetylfucosaminyltransferase n=1 Tax=Rheinheimera sp. EpRS3 TaxID=1712383 RepID=UPI000747ABBB|nr:TDP-N-acetylfucosamine:lipid II N-acetylfucosaminyltransferase [Rheinheimera sp. EpRS3]KUM52484.1 hypothetical protein AR688_09280 [Rheinheimera sp. EpRS3]